jgi:phosphate transport system substrate-binding protein
MKGRTRHLRWLVVPALVAGLVAMGSSVATAGVATKGSKLSGTLNGSGSTFQQAFDQQAIAEFTKSNSGVTINYGGGGSGKGRTDFTDEVVDFAGTDGLFKATDPAPKGGAYDYIPTVVAPITVAYNLSSVSKLQLSGPTIAGIFERKITKWDAPEIQKDNPKAKLPSTSITVAHRSDSSGTTQNFTSFLVKAAPGVWTLGTGSTVSWPSDTQAGNGNPGVATIVKNTDGAIGYVDFSDARAAGLKFASIKNSAGKFVAPSLKAASAAAKTATINPDLTYDPIYAAGAAAYPITSPTWVLAYKTQSDKTKGAALKAFLTFLLTKGQKIAPSVDFAALPPGLAKKALTAVNQIQG